MSACGTSRAEIGESAGDGAADEPGGIGADQAEDGCKRKQDQDSGDTVEVRYGLAGDECGGGYGPTRKRPQPNAARFQVGEKERAEEDEEGDDAGVVGMEFEAHEQENRGGEEDPHWLNASHESIVGQSLPPANPPFRSASIRTAAVLAVLITTASIAKRAFFND